MRGNRALVGRRSSSSRFPHTDLRPSDMSTTAEKQHDWHNDSSQSSQTNPYPLAPTRSRNSQHGVGKHPHTKEGEQALYDAEVVSVTGIQERKVALSPVSPDLTIADRLLALYSSLVSLPPRREHLYALLTPWTVQGNPPRLSS